MKRAHHFETTFCEDPTCGLHVIGCEPDGTPICEIVMSADTTRAVIELCQTMLYDKTVKQVQ